MPSPIRKNHKTNDGIKRSDGSASNPGGSHKTGQKIVKGVVINRHGNDQEVVFDDGEQVLNDQVLESLEESLTTGAIAAFPSATINKGSKMASHKMDQPGKPIGGRKVDQDNTGSAGADGTTMKDHGSPFGKKQKNTGGQFEKLKNSKHDGVMGEHLSPAEIANTITDDGVPLQDLFDSHARSANYISLREFQEIANAYGCICNDERDLVRLMATNDQFMFMEGQDGQGRYWIPRPITEGEVPEAFKKNWENNKSEEDDKPESDDESAEKDDTEKKESKKPWEKDDTKSESRGRNKAPISESALEEGWGYQEEEPESHFSRFKDPGYSQATDPELGDFPFIDNAETDEMADMGQDDFAGKNPDDDMGMEHEGHGMRGGDTGDELETGTGNYGGDKCPECSTPMDELGCPGCGFQHDEFEQNRFDDPSEVAGNRDSFEAMLNSIPDEMDPGQEYENRGREDLDDMHGHGDEFADEYYENRNHNDNMLSEDKHEMESPKGNGVESKTGNKKSGLPSEKTDTTEMGKEWPRKFKNGGSAQEEFGNSKHGDACDGITKHHADLNLKTKQKNTGGQFETFEGGQHSGKMAGGATKMNESVMLLSRHVRRSLNEYVAQNRRLYQESGNYPMTFVVSAADAVQPHRHTNLMEALADAEELIQVFGADQVSFEARFCNSDGNVLLKRLISLPNLPSRGPIVAEGKILFRFPEIARDYADRLVAEGKACRAVIHNWGAAVSSKVTYNAAAGLFKTLSEDCRQIKDK